MPYHAFVKRRAVDIDTPRRIKVVPAYDSPAGFQESYAVDIGELPTGSSDRGHIRFSLFGPMEEPAQKDAQKRDQHEETSQAKLRPALGTELVEITHACNQWPAGSGGRRHCSSWITTAAF